ncbi:MAG: hypothetical protein K9L78_03345 [Victivallales bacterium]|nr:hypothetical protein [Victivallales bacterium]MCF7889134.1 hypothetical protein [Victivallales bacterium]
MKYEELKTKIDSYVRENYPDFYKHSEYNAAITHWMHNPNIKYPYMTNAVFHYLRKKFRLE